MSAPKRSTANYDAAKANYDQAIAEYNERRKAAKAAAEKYSGDNAYNAIYSNAQAKGSEAAKGAANTASAQRLANAIGAGYSRADAARLANQGLENDMNTAYQQAFSNSSNIQSAQYQNALQAAYNDANLSQGNVNARLSEMQYGAAKDQTKYDSDRNRYSSAMGAAGGAFTAISNSI